MKGGNHAVVLLPFFSRNQDTIYYKQIIMIVIPNLCRENPDLEFSFKMNHIGNKDRLIVTVYKIGPKVMCKYQQFINLESNTEGDLIRLLSYAMNEVRSKYVEELIKYQEKHGRS